MARAGMVDLCPPTNPGGMAVSRPESTNWATILVIGFAVHAVLD